MSVRMRLLLMAVLLLFLASQNAFAEAPPTISELLRQHNVELNRQGLIRALKSPDADVRYLSAMKLAEDKVADAIPAIKEALAVETVPRDRANMALAVGLLGDSSGRGELRDICADGNFAGEFRLYAVRYLFDLDIGNDAACLHATEEIVTIFDSENANFGNRVTALGLLVQFRNLTVDEARTVFDLVLHGLNDPEPVVRMEASSALSTLGNRDAVSYLKAAIAQEQDENLRSVFKANLNKLEQTAITPAGP